MKLQSAIRLKPNLLYVAPLLNLVLLLLIFFVVNSTMVIRSGVAVELPETASALRPMEDPDLLTLTIGPQPGVYFNNTQTTWEQLDGLIRASHSKSRQVIINADPLLAYGTVMKAQNIVLEAGRGVSLGSRLAQ